MRTGTEAKQSLLCEELSFTLSWENSVLRGPQAEGTECVPSTSISPSRACCMPASLFTYCPGIPNPQGDIRQRHRESFQFGPKLP